MAQIKTKHYDDAIQSLMMASKEARAGNVLNAKSHFDRADASMKEHVNYLNAIGERGEAEFSMKMYQKQKQVMESAHNFKVKNLRTKKSEAEDGDQDSISKAGAKEVGKGIFLKADRVSTKMKLGQSTNPRYQYKGLHELHAEDQQRVLGRAGNPSMYAGKDHHKFLYPTDSSGRLVHSQRIAAPAHHDFAAAHAAMQESQFKGHQFSEGQGVRVNQPGHELHGKLGIVQAPNPSFPDKVQVGFAGGKSEFMDHSMIQPSRGAPQVQKAKATVIDIRSRLDKKKPKI